MDREEIIRRLAEFPYERGEYWLGGGGALALYGIREQTADIDLGCSSKMADLLEADGCLVRKTPDGKRCFRYGESIEIFEDWLRGSVETVDGIPVASLPCLLEMKRALGREKDLRDIERIREYLARRNGGA